MMSKPSNNSNLFDVALLLLILPSLLWAQEVPVPEDRMVDESSAVTHPTVRRKRPNHRRVHHHSPPTGHRIKKHQNHRILKRCKDVQNVKNYLVDSEMVPVDVLKTRCGLDMPKHLMAIGFLKSPTTLETLDRAEDGEVCVAGVSKTESQYSKCDQSEVVIRTEDGWFNGCSDSVERFSNHEFLGCYYLPESTN